MARRVPAFLATVLAVSGAMTGAVSTSRPAAAGTASSQSGTSLAGHHWRHRVQVDGRSGPDTVVIIGGKDLELDSTGFGTGHIVVRVNLSTGRRVVSSRELVGYLSVLSPWTPWLGATDLDHRGGKELVVGFTTGAHSQFFTVLGFRAGRLRELRAPADLSWGANSSVGTGSFGWRCTSRGVESRSVFPGGGSPTYRVVRNRYVWRTGHWVRTSHVARTVPADAQGNPPAYTDAYPRFICPGLPDNVL
jgi:hypothetical protein